MAKRIPLRTEISQGDTWDLSPLYKDEPAWNRAYSKLEKLIPQFEDFRGTLATSAKAIRNCYDFYIGFERAAEKLGNYAFLRQSEDVSNDTYQGMMARYIHLATRANEAGSFIGPEIQAIPRKKMAEYMKSALLKPYRFALEQLLRYRPHILSVAEERVLAMQGQIDDTADKIFSQLNDADLKFGFVKNERGESIEVTQGSMRGLLESPSRTVRREAFKKFYAEYQDHANTLAATLDSSILHDVYQARVRKYPSALEASLFAENIPLAVYDKLIEAVHANLRTVYRYFEIRRRALKLREIRGYDTYAPIVPVGRQITPYKKAVETVCAALAPLGTEYVRVLEQGLTGRWVDRYENKGKRSGAFSGGGFDGPPYILLNYREDVLDHVFTLAHEAGHSMHTYYSAKTQPFQDYHYTIFVAEVASTFNEQLLNHYMLERAQDKSMRAFLINREIDEIRGTLIRQTMFAEFEKIAHAAAEAGEPLTLEFFRSEYQKLLDLYLGPHVAMDEELSLECFRIPHFYRAFYVYKYATGLSAAIALSEQVLQGGTKECERYLAFLKSGGSAYPLDLLRAAGVDMETPGPVDLAMERFERLVDELEAVL